MNRKIVGILLILFTFFVIYNTLIPFEFQTNTIPIDTFLETFSVAYLIKQLQITSLTDIAGNILLFIPFGFLMYTWLLQGGNKGKPLISILSGTILSLLIEVVQLFFKGRTSSVTDVFNNTFGTFIGTASAWFYLRMLAKTSRRIAWEFLHSQPLTLILVSIFGIQLFAAILPFNVSITVSDLKTSFKNLNIIPFDYRSLGLLLFDSRNRLDGIAFNWFKFIEDWLYWIVWGYIAALCFHTYWYRKTNGKLLMLAVCFLPGIVFECLQLFIVSRYSDINDMISNALGVFFGLFLYKGLCRDLRNDGDRTWMHLKGVLFVYIAFILFAGLQPFDFRFSSIVLKDALNIHRLVPFLAYFNKTTIWNIYDLVASLFMFFPVSLWVSHHLREKGHSWQIIYIVTILAGFGLGSLIESIQLFSLTRTGDITDALLYGAGGFLGTFALFYFYKEIKPSISRTRERDLLDKFRKARPSHTKI